MQWVHLDFEGNPIDPFARPPAPRCRECNKGDQMTGDDTMPELLSLEDGTYAHERCMG